LAIFDAEARTLTYVTGLPAPEEITNFGTTTYLENDTIYVSISTASANPAIYAINSHTAIETRGLEIEATQIDGIGRLSR
jgi:hypothetical protein